MLTKSSAASGDENAGNGELSKVIADECVVLVS